MVSQLIYVFMTDVIVIMFVTTGFIGRCYCHAPEEPMSVGLAKAITFANKTCGYKHYDNNICHKNIYKLTYHLSTIKSKKLFWQKYPNYITRITFHIHHQKWVSWKVHFPIHQKKPCQLDWQKLVFFEKIGSVLEKLSSLYSLLFLPA